MNHSPVLHFRDKLLNFFRIKCLVSLSQTLHSNVPYGSPVLQGIGEPTVFLGSSVFFAIKDAVAAARSESGLVGPFSLDSPATPERACLACASPFTQMVKMLKY